MKISTSRATLPISKYGVKHSKKTMSKFFYSALQQAKDANPPQDYRKEDVFHVVCVGSNARLPKIICFKLD